MNWVLSDVSIGHWLQIGHRPVKIHMFFIFFSWWSGRQFGENSSNSNSVCKTFNIYIPHWAIRMLIISFCQIENLKSSDRNIYFLCMLTAYSFSHLKLNHSNCASGSSSSVFGVERHFFFNEQLLKWSFSKSIDCLKNYSDCIQIADEKISSWRWCTSSPSLYSIQWNW